MSEIIIDGVNVAECCCYENSKCLWTKRYYENNIVPVCEKVKDCYYKQLQRLQAENEELKHKNEILLGQLVINDGEDVTVQISQSQFDEYNELKVENEELKKEINIYRNSIVANHDRAIGKRFAELLEENEEFKKALEEIREIAKIHQYFSPRLLVINGDIGQVQNLTMTEIYKKCSEVLK